MSMTQQGINAVDIAVSILNFIVSRPHPCRAIDIAAGCNLSKSRLHKYLVSLCRTGMLYQDENGHYGPGNTIRLLAEKMASAPDIFDRIDTLLMQFRDRMNYSAGLVVPDRAGLMLRRYHRSFRNVDIDFLDNTPVPVSGSAAGMIYQAFGAAPRARDAQSESIRRQGYAVRHQPMEGIPGSQSIACPVFHREQLIAIGVTMGFFADREEIEMAGKALQQALAALSPE